MWRTVLIIVVLCAGFAWFFTSSAPQRSGTLTLTPAATFPVERTADLGRSMARIVPHCPGLAQWGGQVLFTDIKTYANRTHIYFSVPVGAAVPAHFGPYTAPCDYELEGENLRVREASCQALCLGKLPDPAQDIVIISLNPAPQTPAQ